jgi:sulfatase modifying factor 1
VDRAKPRQTSRAVLLTALLVVCEVAAQAVGTAAQKPKMVPIPAGVYTPLYRDPTPPSSSIEPKASLADPNRTARRVAPFEMDVDAVTNAEYLAFVMAHPEWRRSNVKRLFADELYLYHWRGDLELGPQAPADSPVVNVSWFAARAYLRTVGKELPTVDQWEYVAAADERRRDASRAPMFIERLRAWYGQALPDPLPAVTSGMQNVYGVRGLHGLIWEWTLDFNSALVTGESRGDNALERSLYCGASASGAGDFENYPAFMRYALRSSLQARYNVSSLGFRGVRNHARSSR